MTITLGVTMPLIDTGGSPSFVRDFAQAAEDLGYQDLSLADHVLGANVANRPDWGDRNTSADYFHDPFVLFGFLLVYGAVLTLAAFIPPSLPMVYILGSVIGIGMGAWFVIPDALLGDCIDYDELHTGVRSESGYTVIETNLQQFMEVPAYAIPFTTVGLLGYLSNGGCGCGCCPRPRRARPRLIEFEFAHRAQSPLNRRFFDY